MSRGHKDVSKLRFFVDADIMADTVELTDAVLLAQWRTVLRLQAGNEVILIGGDRMEALAIINELTKSHASLTVVDRYRNEREPHRAVTLYCAILKRENFEWVAQKAVEAGVTRLVPLLTERTVKLGFKRERLETIMREAAEQSGRGAMPVLSEPMAFADALRDSAAVSARYFFDTGDNVRPSADKGDAVALFIGPEGGWSESERATAASEGVASASLGKRILRAETAAVVATYLFANEG